MRKIKNSDEIYMEYAGFLGGDKLVKLNTRSVSIQAFSDDKVNIDYYPKEKKKKKNTS